MGSFQYAAFIAEEIQLLSKGKTFLTPQGELEICGFDGDTVIYLNHQVPGLEFRAIRLHFLEIAFNLDVSTVLDKNVKVAALSP